MVYFRKGNKGQPEQGQNGALQKTRAGERKRDHEEDDRAKKLVTEAENRYLLLKMASDNSTEWSGLRKRGALIEKPDCAVIYSVG